MVRLENLTKEFLLDGHFKRVADNLNYTFPSGKAVAILGKNGAGKSTLLQMIAGRVPATSGRIVSDGTISWPVGFAGSFHPDLTGVQNVRFVGRIYGADTDALVDFVEDFADLGGHFYLPVKTYSSGMRSRLAFGTSMGISFDTYLIDEVTAVGDAAFRARSNQVFLERMQRAGAIFVSHSMRMVQELCDMACVLEDGHLYHYDDTADAIAHYNSMVAQAA